MRHAFLPWRAIGIAALALPLMATSAHAYIGPGGAVSALGALLALIAAIVIALFGFLWFPIKRLMRRRRTEKQAGSEGEVPPAPTDEEPAPR